MKRIGVLFFVLLFVMTLPGLGLAAAEKPVIGVIVPTLAHPFCRCEIDLAKRVGDVLGAKIEVWNYEWNVDKEIEGIENLIAMGADGIVVHASNAEIGGTEIQLAAASKIPIVVADQYPSTVDEQSVHLEIDYPDVEQDLNRWMPLVKWLLAIPHYIVLAVLGAIAVVVVIIAWFAILFTGRYPRSLFDYVVGVSRWALRVQAYAVLLVTDQYPPFSMS